MAVVGLPCSLIDSLTLSIGLLSLVNPAVVEVVEGASCTLDQVVRGPYSLRRGDTRDIAEPS